MRTKTKDREVLSVGGVYWANYRGNLIKVKLRSQHGDRFFQLVEPKALGYYKDNVLPVEFPVYKDRQNAIGRVLKDCSWQIAHAEKRIELIRGRIRALRGKMTKARNRGK